MPNVSASEGYADTSVPAGSTIVIVVSKGPSPGVSTGTLVPETVGKPQADALDAVQGMGLNAQVFTVASASLARGRVMAQWPNAGETTAAGSTMALLVSAGPAIEGAALTRVPDVVGQSEAAALDTLERFGLRGHVISEYSPTVPAGVVFGQLPDERSRAAAPSKTSPWLWVALAAAAVVVIVGLIFFLGRGNSANVVTVPNLVGMSEADARKALSDEGLYTGAVTGEKSDTQAAGSVLSQNPTVGTEVKEGSAVDLVVVAAAELVAVPDVVGRTKDTAQQLIADAQLQVSVTEAPNDTVEAGLVVSQSPKGEQKVPVGTEVGIVVSTGAEQKNVSVPNLNGLTESAASQKLGEVGLTGEFVDTTSDTIAAGIVVSQAPPPDASVAKGTQIAVLVSSGPATSENETLEVPNVVGKMLADATAILNDVGLQASSLKADGSGKPANQVLYQTPAAGDTAPLQSQVVLIISSGS